MTTVANQPVNETETGRQRVMPNVISGLATGLFSIPEGMAYAQLGGINTAVPNPDGSKASQSRDFLGEGLGNLAGSFFQSMAMGGALSRIKMRRQPQTRWNDHNSNQMSDSRGDRLGLNPDPNAKREGKKPVSESRA